MHCLLFTALAIFSVLPAQIPSVTWKDLKSRLRHPDTLYVLNFWSTWCRPCIAELPYFQKAADSLQPKYPIRFYLISLDFPPDGAHAAQRLLRQKNISLSAVWLAENNPNTWIPDVDSAWDGSIPFSILWPSRKSKLGGFHSAEEVVGFVLQGYETPRDK
jgi:thiol-disulfide isomerase/thioredoxin